MTGGGPRPTSDEGLNLSDTASALTVAEGKPFTLALWVRTDDWEHTFAHFVRGNFYINEKYRMLHLSPNPKGIAFLLQEGPPGTVDKSKVVRRQWDMSPTTDWVHLSVSRDEKGLVRLGVNGERKPIEPNPFPYEFRFQTLALAWLQGKPFTADFDEFCLFDRVLTDDEIKQLAGRGGKK